MNILREACVDSFAEAKAVDILGVERIELCDNLEVGGTTPSLGTITLAKENLKALVFPIIRPRGGNYVFSEDEIKIMEIDIEACRRLDIKGVVVGALTPENTIDENAIKRFVKKAGDMDLTFHMAFDEIEYKFSALDQLISLGVKRVLTKGGQGKASDNINVLKELVDYSKGRITILAGGSVTGENYMDIAEKTGVKEVHGRKIV